MLHCFFRIPLRKKGRLKTQEAVRGFLPWTASCVLSKGFPAATCSPTDSLRSTIGAGGLDCRVRHGTGYDTSALTTENPIYAPDGFFSFISERISEKERKRPRRISTGQLNPSQGLHLRPIYPVVSRTPYFLYETGYLILKSASRLDAFSGYPVRT